LPSLLPEIIPGGICPRNTSRTLYAYSCYDEADCDFSDVVHGKIRSQDSAVGIATGYGLDDQGAGV
jgi:hypothetical protein